MRCERTNGRGQYFFRGMIGVAVGWEMKDVRWQEGIEVVPSLHPHSVRMYIRYKRHTETALQVSPVVDKRKPPNLREGYVFQKSSIYCGCTPAPRFLREEGKRGAVKEERDRVSGRVESLVFDAPHLISRATGVSVLNEFLRSTSALDGIGDWGLRSPMTVFV